MNKESRRNRKQVLSELERLTIQYSISESPVEFIFASNSGVFYGFIQGKKMNVMEKIKLDMKLYQGFNDLMTKMVGTRNYKDYISIIHEQVTGEYQKWEAF